MNNVFTQTGTVPSQPHLKWWKCDDCGTETASEVPPVATHQCSNPNGCNSPISAPTGEVKRWEPYFSSEELRSMMDESPYGDE